MHNVRNANGTWQPQGWGYIPTPTGSMTIAITAMPDGSSQFVGISSNGVIYHDIRFANGNWQGWNSLPAPDSSAPTAADITGMPNGSSQLIALTSG